MTPYHEQTVVFGVQFEREFEVSALDLKESKAEASVVVVRECEVGEKETWRRREKAQCSGSFFAIVGKERWGS